MSASPAETAIHAFLSKYEADVRSLFSAARASLQKRFPRGFELVYDNYNALAIGYSPTARASDVVVSIAAYPKWVRLFFLRGITLPDTTHRLEGSGARVRSLRLASVDTLGATDVHELIQRAAAPSAHAFAAAPRLEVVVKSISAKQRPRSAAPRTGRSAR